MNELYTTLLPHLTREEIKIMKTAYENLLKKDKMVKAYQGEYNGSIDKVKAILGIDDGGIEFLIAKHLLINSDCKILYDNSSRIWFLQDTLEKLAIYVPLYRKEEERFDLRFKLYKIFGKKDFDKAFDWVFSSDMGEWEHKMSCIKYNCSVFGTELTSGNTLEEAKKLYELLNN